MSSVAFPQIVLPDQSRYSIDRSISFYVKEIQHGASWLVGMKQIQRIDGRVAEKIVIFSSFSWPEGAFEALQSLEEMRRAAPSELFGWPGQNYCCAGPNGILWDPN